jgi:hypothetical protein
MVEIEDFMVEMEDFMVEMEVWGGGFMVEIEGFGGFLWLKWRFGGFFYGFFFFLPCVRKRNVAF